jgi:hypothetical protein
VAQPAIRFIAHKTQNFSLRGGSQVEINRLNISPYYSNHAQRPDPSQIEGVKGEMVQLPKCKPDRAFCSFYVWANS